MYDLLLLESVDVHAYQKQEEWWQEGTNQSKIDEQLIVESPVAEGDILVKSEGKELLAFNYTVYNGQARVDLAEYYLPLWGVLVVSESVWNVEIRIELI